MSVCLSIRPIGQEIGITFGAFVVVYGTLYSLHETDRHIFHCCIQVKYDLTKAVTGDDDKETIHCEFDIAGSGIEWTSGQICLFFM